MKKNLVSVLLAAALALLASCTSYQPVGMNDSFPQNCAVLGRVTYEASSSNAGYTRLYEEAKKKYPDADDVVHVMVDIKKSMGSTYYVMSGIAVKYNK